MPRLLVMVAGFRGSANYWAFDDEEPDHGDYDGKDYGWVSIGQAITRDTGWNLSNMYYVNDRPGTPLTQHKPAGTDHTNRYVTQVNYVTGYVCEASFQ